MRLDDQLGDVGRLLRGRIIRSRPMPPRTSAKIGCLMGSRTRQPSVGGGGFVTHSASAILGSSRPTEQACSRPRQCLGSRRFLATRRESAKADGGFIRSEYPWMNGARWVTIPPPPQSRIGSCHVTTRPPSPSCSGPDPCQYPRGLQPLSLPSTNVNTQTRSARRQAGAYAIDSDAMWVTIPPRTCGAAATKVGHDSAAGWVT